MSGARVEACSRHGIHELLFSLFKLVGGYQLELLREGDIGMRRPMLDKYKVKFKNWTKESTLTLSSFRFAILAQKSFSTAADMAATPNN